MKTKREITVDIKKEIIQLTLSKSFNMELANKPIKNQLIIVKI